MIRIAIVDDEKKCSDALAAFIKRYFGEVGEEYSLAVYGDGIDFISSYKNGYDLVFMDIKMKCMNGLDAAVELRKIDGSVVLVFVTQMIQYAVKGYEVNAFDFIVKPVDYYSFEMKMTRIFNELKQRRTVNIVVSQYNSAVVLSSSEIYYAEVYGHNITYHTKRGVVKGRGSLAELEGKLLPVYFRSCHRCFLVNMAYVTEMGDTFVKVGGDKVPLSRLKKKEFFNMLANYFGRSL